MKSADCNNYPREALTPIIQQAWNESPIAKRALGESFTYNQVVHIEQRLLLSFTPTLASSFNNDIPLLQQKVLNRIDNDIKITQQLNNAIANTPNADITYSLKTNKMALALEGARELVEDLPSFEAIIQGHFPPGFEGAPPFPVLIGDVNSHYGNSQATFLSTALIETAASCVPHENTNILSVQDVLHYDWIDTSAITHVTPIPAKILETDKTLAQALEQYTFHYSDEVTPWGLAFVHSGYAFGGHRDEGRYAGGKWLGPEDCSSWIAKIAGCDHPFSTLDQLYTYRALTPDNKGYIEPGWQMSDMGIEMMTKFKPIEITDPFIDIHPGQVVLFRHFETADHHAVGESGHTALVLGVTEDGKVVTLNYSREMPEREGFGVSLYDWQSDETTETVFFDLNQSALNPPALHID